LAVERAQLQADLGRRVLILRARRVQLIDVSGGDGEEAGVFELCVTGNDLVFAFEHGVLCSTVSCADAKAALGALFLVGGEPGGVPVDLTLRS
jgi:hypothetical protein